MDAVEFLKERKRMCSASYDRETQCADCKAYNHDGNKAMCKVLLQNGMKPYTESDMVAAVAIVEEWSKEHPMKTLLDDFLEKFPKAKLIDDGTPRVCPYQLGYEKEDGQLCMKLECIECWSRALDEVVK